MVAHQVYMAEAIRLAQRGLRTTMPNPRVGCVLVKQGEVVGRGWHQFSGRGHAEVNAIADAGVQAKGSTAYVTLEPCSHTGQTGPCCEALVAAGVSELVYGMEDPNPQVAGRGIDFLEAAGVVIIGPVMEEQCRELNPGFIKRMNANMPYVRCKLAMSLDGRTGMASGESKWITAPAARSDVQRLRARSCAIVSGIDSILRDNPAMTTRKEDLGLPEQEADLALQVQPLRVVLDTQLRMPIDAQLFRYDSPVLLVHGEQVDADTAQALRDRHSQLELLSGKLRDGKIDLHWLCRELAGRQCNEILVETGANLAGSFLRRGLLDEIIIYMAPKLLGSRARPIFELPLDTMAAQLPLDIVDISPVGRDWKIVAKPDMEG